MRILSYFIGVLLLIFVGCDSGNVEDKNRKVYLTVYDFSLYQDELKGVLSGNETKADSTQMVNAFIDRWIRDRVMLYQANDKIDSLSEINHLVNEYRNSLILHNYEELLVHSLLDTIVTDQSVKSFYEQAQNDFILNEDICELSIVKSINVISKTNDLIAFFKNKDDLSSFELTRDQVFYSKKWIKKRIDSEGVMVNSGEMYHVKEKNSNAYYFIHGIIKQGEFAPLEYVENQIKKLILHNRKNKLLVKIKDQHYKEAVKKKHLRYFN